jgi:lambda family phage portal protein
VFSFLKAPLKPSKPARVPGSAAYAREILAQSWEAYRLARRDRPREHHQPQPYSGDAAILGSHNLMNRRTRDLVRNTAQGKRIRQALPDLVVGTGIQTFSWPFLPSELFEIVTELETLQDGELGPRLQFAMESDDLFDEWSGDPKQFDAEGRLSRMDMERLAFGECVTVGSCLIVRTFRKDYDLVPLAYQLIEREQLDESRDRPASPGKNKIAGGVEFDAGNRTVAYHVYVDHPHDSIGIATGATHRKRIPAERVIDVTLFDRPSSALGASWYDATGQTTWDRDSYVDSEIRSAAIDAAFAFMAKLTDGAKYGAWGFDDDNDDDDDYGNREFKLGHSPTAVILDKDEELDMIRETRPNKDAPAFLKMLDRDQAGGVGISYYTLTGDYASTNFSSTRAAKLDEDLHIAPLQRWFATHVALRIRREFNAMAAAGGLFRSVRPRIFRDAYRTYQRFDAIGNGRELLDPYKEGQARTERLRTGISTFKEECAKRGQHWLRVLMQRAIETKVTQIFGVSLDFSGGGGGPPNATEEAGEAEEAEEAEETTEAAADE